MASEGVLTNELANAIERVAARYGVHNIRVFGSFARGTATSSSDLDLLVDYPAEHGGFKFVEFCEALSALVRRPVDVVTERSLPRALRREILEEAVPLAQAAAR